MKGGCQQPELVFGMVQQEPKQPARRGGASTAHNEQRVGLQKSRHTTIRCLQRPQHQLDLYEIKNNYVPIFSEFILEIEIQNLKFGTSVDHYKTLIICNLFQCEQKHRQIKEKNKLFWHSIKQLKIVREDGEQIHFFSLFKTTHILVSNMQQLIR